MWDKLTEEEKELFILLLFFGLCWREPLQDRKRDSISTDEISSRMMSMRHKNVVAYGFDDGFKIDWDSEKLK